MQQCCAQHCCTQHRFTGCDDLSEIMALLWYSINVAIVTDAAAMDSDDDVVLALAIVADKLCQTNGNGRARRRRRTWCRPWLLRRPEYGAYETLLRELQREDHGRGVRNFLRMEIPQFEMLCEAIGPSIERANTNMRQSICPRERIAITLRFLASGKRQ